MTLPRSESSAASFLAIATGGTVLCATVTNCGASGAYFAARFSRKSDEAFVPSERCSGKIFS
jgi:hypothetical protein